MTPHANRRALTASPAGPGLAAAFGLLALWLTAAFATLRASDDEILFARDVLPILSDSCFHCHGPDPVEGRKGDLRLDLEEEAKRDRGGYRAILPGDPGASELVARILAEDPDELMPPPSLGRPLAPEQTEILRRWIEQGAPWGRHWAFERPERPEFSEKEGHPVDALVARRLGEEGLAPAPPADRRTLVRRLSLDLTGLPPDPAETEAFVADENEDAWERLVDRALASPAFGERMAWEWLEAARYADSNGYQGDGERDMWPWRDWVVRAYNENLPYDRFSLLQLAGDLLPEAGDEGVLATAFNRNHMINGEGGRIAEENRVGYVFDMTETVSTVWMALTLNCARCHDHKYDPLTQREYYQLTAFFNQTPVTGAGRDPHTPPLLEVAPPGDIAARDAARERLREARAAAARRSEEIAEGLAAWETEAASRLAEDPHGGSDESEEARGKREALLAALALAPMDRDEEQKKRVLDAYHAGDEAMAKLQAAVATAEREERRLHAAIPKVMVMRDLEEPRPTHLLHHGLYDDLREEVGFGLPQWLLPRELPEQPSRLELARWLLDPGHPLTARVAVNRLWQMLFGTGLVSTAEDFGLQAEYPAQRELLDWLAVEFVESGWDVKGLLRTLLLSETYRRSSASTSPATRELRERDPANRLLARGPRHRLPSWMIRDQALAASGLLQRGIGGAPVFPYQPEGVWEEATFGRKEYVLSEGSDLHRRSLYTFWRRIVGPTEFFDSAKRQVCEVNPLRTNTPMHALTTLNSITYVEAARALADRVLALPAPGSSKSNGNGNGEAPSANGASPGLDAATAARFEQIGLLLLGRAPSPEEAAIWRRALDRALARYEAEPGEAGRFLAHGAHRAESPEQQAPPATRAAWTALCLHLLNLDEALSKE